MKVKIVQFGLPDSDGDIFYKESIILPDDGEALVTKDFDYSKVMGKSKLSMDDNGVYAEIEFAQTLLGQGVKKVFPESVYPAIEYRRIEDKIKIYSVGLCEIETIKGFNDAIK